MEFNCIELLNWDRYQEKRKDVEHPSWFRMDHSFAFDPEWSHLEGEEKWVFVYVLCTASMKNRRELHLTPKIIADGAKVSLEKVSSSIQKLSEKGALRVRHGRVTSPSRKRAATDKTDRQTRQTDKTDIPSVGLDFDLIWETYPRRVNKTEARTRFLRLIKTPEDYAALRTSVANYASECKAQGTEEKYIKHCATFLGTEDKQAWRDWIDHKTSAPKKSSHAKPVAGAHQRDGDLDSEIQNVIEGVNHGSH
jgi:hypothetical protein